MAIALKNLVPVHATVRPAVDDTARAARLQLTVRQLLSKLRLAVVHGGNKSVEGAVINSAGNPRSWKSYEAVARDIADSMRRLGCHYVTLAADDMRLGQRLKDERIQLAWLNTGGVQGQASVAHAAAMLEMLGIPYVGHDPLSAAILDNKHVFKRQLATLGIRTAPFLSWHPREGALDPSTDRRFRETFAKTDAGFIIKPVSGRASLNVHFVEHAAEISSVSQAVFDVTRNTVLIEAFIPGREFCIAVTGPTVARAGMIERLSRPFAFAAVERVLAGP